jgi:emfourin
VGEVVTQRIHVEVTRTGGFGGLETSRSADTDSLPADDARGLAELVDGLDLEALREHPAGTRAVPDAFQYDVSISRGGEHVRLRVRDPDVPAELRPLIQFVLQRA